MKYLFTLIYLCSFSLFSQEVQKDTLYLDQNLVPISKTLFKTRSNSVIFHSRNYEKDSVIESRLHYHLYFGKMSLKDVNGILTNFNEKSNEKIEKDKTLLIYHYETLFGYEDVLKRREESFYKFINSKDSKRVSLNNRYVKPRLKKYTKKDYLSKIKKSAKKNSKIIKKVSERFNTTTIHVVRNNKGYPLKNKYFTWIEDSTSTFQNKYHGTIMVLRPNGNYFIRYGHLIKEKIYTILEEDNWSSFYKDWGKSIKSNSSNGFGIVEKLMKKKKISAIQ